MSVPLPAFAAAKILIVDDERANVLLLERLLQQAGTSRARPTRGRPSSSTAACGPT